MSRVGKQPVQIPAQVKVAIESNTISVEGPKGKLAHELPAGITVERKDSELQFKRLTEEKRVKGFHGLTRTLVDNMVKGVTNGFMKELEIVGTGFKAQVAGSKLELFVGFTHPVAYVIPKGITIEVPKPTQVIVKGIDKSLVGQVAARIRSFYKPEPYKGKGIKYVGEIVRRKAGKAVA